MLSLVISKRFCGPPGTANGGYLSGRLAALVGGDAEITLRRATPLGRELRVASAGHGGVDLFSEKTLLAEARPVEVEISLPERVTIGEAVAGARAFPRFTDHPVPRCFVCGTERPPGDGLRIFPGPIPGREAIYAAPWIPDRSLGDERGIVRPELLWAALDCPGAFAVNEPPMGLALLGRLAAGILREVEIGTSLVVMAWPIARDRRKLQAGTALVTAAGDPVAVARATWVLT